MPINPTVIRVGGRSRALELGQRFQEILMEMARQERAFRQAEAERKSRAIANMGRSVSGAINTIGQRKFSSAQREKDRRFKREESAASAERERARNAALYGEEFFPPLGQTEGGRGSSTELDSVRRRQLGYYRQKALDEFARSKFGVRDYATLQKRAQQYGGIQGYADALTQGKVRLSEQEKLDAFARTKFDMPDYATLKKEAEPYGGIPEYARALDTQKAQSRIDQVRKEAAARALGKRQVSDQAALEATGFKRALSPEQIRENEKDKQALMALGKDDSISEQDKVRVAQEITARINRRNANPLGNKREEDSIEARMKKNRIARLGQSSTWLSIDPKTGRTDHFEVKPGPSHISFEDEVKTKIQMRKDLADSDGNFPSWDEIDARYEAMLQGWRIRQLPPDQRPAPQPAVTLDPFIRAAMQGRAQPLVQPSATTGPRMTPGGLPSAPGALQAPTTRPAAPTTQPSQGLSKQQVAQVNDAVENLSKEQAMMALAQMMKKAGGSMNNLTPEERSLFKKLAKKYRGQ